MDAYCGTVQAIRFYNPENGFAIARLRLDDGVSVIHISGALLGVEQSEWLQVEGSWSRHSHKGWHLQVKQFSFPPPPTLADLEAYLAAGFVAGITPALAARLVERFGLEALAVMEQSPERLREVQGISAKRARQIQANWSECQKRNRLRTLLQNPSIPRPLAGQLYGAFGAPFTRPSKKFESLLNRLYALELETADPIAQLLGVPSNAPARVEASVRRILHQSGDEGHVYAERAELVRQAAEQLGVSEKIAASAVRRLSKQYELIVERDRIYLKPWHNAEVRAAQRLRALMGKRAARLAEFQNTDWSKAFNGLAVTLRRVLTPQQRHAVQTALTSRVAVLTGGPGTGKTTTVRAVVELLKKRGFTFVLAAPTGRAAKRLSEACAAPAQTLHRLLQFKALEASENGSGGEQPKKFARALAQPLAADFVIVDECSMLDLRLLDDLLQSVRPTSQLLFVGDPHQLPSIGAGKVLQDLIDSGVVPVVALDAVFRQGRRSSIALNAHRIHHGQLPILSREARDFFMIGENEPKRAARKVVKLVAELIPIRFGLDPLAEIQVLTPMRQGAAGVAAFNTALQSALNPPRADRPEWRQGERIFRVGDKVAQTRNNYAKGIFNGDIGRIAALDAERQCLSVEFDGQRVDYTFEELSELTHAYALTIHKAQGSEYRAVVIVMLTGHRRLLQRNLLYTALTRAAELAVIVGSKKAIALAVRNNKTAQRRSHLAARLAAPRSLNPAGLGNHHKNDRQKKQNVRRQGKKGAPVANRRVQRRRGRSVRT